MRTFKRIRSEFRRAAFSMRERLTIHMRIGTTMDGTEDERQVVGKFHDYELVWFGRRWKDVYSIAIW